MSTPLYLTNRYRYSLDVIIRISFWSFFPALNNETIESCIRLPRKCLPSGLLSYCNYKVLFKLRCAISVMANLFSQSSFSPSVVVNVLDRLIRGVHLAPLMLHAPWTHGVSPLCEIAMINIRQAVIFTTCCPIDWQVVSLFLIRARKSVICLYCKSV